LTPEEKTMEYSRQWATEEAERKGFVNLDQFNNPNNRQAHIETTGPEIWRDTEGTVTHFVSAMGTTGTITGTSTFLKGQNPKIQIVGAQPQEGDRIPGIRKWSPAFLPGIYQPERIDRLIYVSREDAIRQARALAKEEGIMGGMSTGGALTCALKVIEGLESGVVVFIACDRGDRYLSSELYAD
jgi:cysteine synthase B